VRRTPVGHTVGSELMARMLLAVFRQALASLRVRFARQAITGAGIALSLAFFAGVRTAGGELGDPAKLNWMTGLSLLMSLVGVTNAMLMSVAERYREIGTFKCLGASDSFIVGVFLTEAVILGAVGSAVGGLLGSYGAAMLFGQRVSMDTVLIAMGIGMLMTILAAIVPAFQAARMPAAAALRTEA
jgi:putative ABC transport system permease protein